MRFGNSFTVQKRTNFSIIINHKKTDDNLISSVNILRLRTGKTMSHTRKGGGVRCG